jgi:hypothetical protein
MGGSLGFLVNTIFSIFEGFLFIPTMVFGAVKYCLIPVLVVAAVFAVFLFYGYMIVQLVS